MTYSFATPFGEKIKQDLGDGTYLLIEPNDPQYLNWIESGNTPSPYPYDIAPEVVAWKEQQDSAE